MPVQFYENQSPNDTAYRWGGDEFPVIFKRTTGEEALTAIQHVAELGAPSFSFGIATFPVDADDHRETWQVAETRLKEHKAERKVGRD